MPRVLNKRDGLPPPLSAVYIGRPSKWGNPFIIGRDGDRADVIAKYRLIIENAPDARATIKRELKGKDLVCWCAPDGCHGDILLEIANEE